MSYAREIEEALKDGFLRRTLDKFAVEYRAGRDRVFAEVDERRLIQRIADVKDDAARHMEELYELLLSEQPPPQEQPSSPLSPPQHDAAGKASLG